MASYPSKSDQLRHSGSGDTAAVRLRPPAPGQQPSHGDGSTFPSMLMRDQPLAPQEAIQRFTPAQTAQTLAALKANERPYLQTMAPQPKGDLFSADEGGVEPEEPFTIEALQSREAGGPGGVMMRGGGQTRDDSERESALMAGQIQQSLSNEVRLAQAMEQDEAVREAAIAQRMAADKAAQEAAFLERYGIPYSKEAAEVMAKFKGEGDAAEKLMTLVFDAQQQEAEERAQINPADTTALNKHKALWERKVKDYLLAAGIGSKAPSQAGLREDAQGQSETMQGTIVPKG